MIKQRIVHCFLASLTFTIVLISAGSHVKGQILSPLPQSAEITEIAWLDQHISQFIAQGRLRDAIPLAQRVLELRQHRLKQDDFTVIDSLHTLASLYLNQGRYAEAEPLFKQALVLHQQIGNPANSTTATIIHNLAVVYMSQNFAADKGFSAPRYAAYILTAQGQSQGIDLGDTFTINQAIETFRAALRDPQTPPAQLKHAARKLDALIMQPVRQLLGNAQTVLLSPDGALNLIPFEALVDENNHYLVETYAFTYLTSGRDLLRLATHSPSQTAAVLLANPTFDKLGEPVTQVLHSQINQNSQTRSTSFTNLFKQTFSSLPETAAEVEAIAPLLNVHPLIGSQASEEAVKQVNRPRILHIATHGFFVTPTTQNELPENTLADNPLLLSGLVLAGFKLKPQNREDGILTALEVAGLNLLGTKLVVLSACDTGLGRLSAGEGIYGLRRALTMAGAESQLISLWKVEDAATKDLIVSYYQKLLAGQGRSEALRQTQQDLLKRPDRSHPYYWAGFILSGDWRPLP